MTETLYNLWLCVRTKKAYPLDHVGPTDEFGRVIWVKASAKVPLSEAERMRDARVVSAGDEEIPFIQGTVDTMILPADAPKEEWPEPRANQHLEQG